MTSIEQEISEPWASFCISTYKRPEMIREQILVILQQTFKDFEIVISDNDPGSTVSTIIEEINDARIRYAVNEQNLGMVKSFNRSVERARGEFVVMITDDDPVDPSFLFDMHHMQQQHPGYSLYAGFERKGEKGAVEVLKNTEVVSEILDMQKTPSILWSSSIMKRADVIKVGGMPDYGSPHLADHAMIVMVGSISGMVVKNKMYSFIQKHESNFSKFNFNYYVTGCEKFYALMKDFIQKNNLDSNALKAVQKHIIDWFRISFFDLKKYYLRNNNQELKSELENFRKKMFEFDFIQKNAYRFKLKNLIFNIKNLLGVI